MQISNERVRFWNLLLQLELFPDLGCDGAYEFIQVIIIMDIVGLAQ